MIRERGPASSIRCVSASAYYVRPSLPDAALARTALRRNKETVHKAVAPAAVILQDIDQETVHNAVATAAVILRDIFGIPLSISPSVNQSRHARLAAGPSMDLYHQTDHACAAAICNSQTFRPGSAGLAGPGMYFAVSVADTNHKAHKHGVVLCATVRLGNIYRINPNGDSSLCLSKLLALGYDSVMIPRNGDEYVVYASDQISRIRRV